MNRSVLFIAKGAVHQREEIVDHRPIGGGSVRSCGQCRGQPPAELYGIGSSLAPVVFSRGQEPQGGPPLSTLEQPIDGGAYVRELVVEEDHPAGLHASANEIGLCSLRQPQAPGGEPASARLSLAALLQSFKGELPH